MVTVQVRAEPVHAPDHEVKGLDFVGLAVRVTVVPAAKVSVQSVPQLMPAGLEVTVPSPVRVTVSSYVLGGGGGGGVVPARLNVAVAVRAALIDTVQVSAVPVHA